MAAMNIDRSLDDIVKDARKKNSSGPARRRKGPQAKPRPAVAAKGDVEMGDAAGPASGVAGGVSKRRSRNKRKGALSAAGNPLVAAAADAAAASTAGAANSARPANRWPHDKHQTKADAKHGPGSVTGLKVVVANLDRKVTSADVQDLFSQVGPVTHALVIADATGTSTGTAELVFRNRNNALTAVQQYNGVPLNGRALKLSLSTAKSSTLPASSGPRGSRTNPLDRPLGSGTGPSGKQKKRKGKKGAAAIRNSMTF